MGDSYAERKKAEGALPRADTVRHASPQALHMDALRAGMVNPTAADMGHRIDLPEAMRAKMENAFGDLSAVQLYQSPAVAEAGAQAVAQGNKIAFAPGETDFSTRRGQKLLGHELSHVKTQARGEVTGKGFLNDRTLEARAEREGAMAAAGEKVYSGPVTGAMSAATPSLSMAAPMQASREDDRAKATAQSMVSARQLQQKLDTSGATATDKQVNQLAEYQKNLGDVQYFLNHKDEEGLADDERFQKGRRVHENLEAMQRKSQETLQNRRSSKKKHSQANEQLKAMRGINEDIPRYTPSSPEFEILKRSKNKEKRIDAYNNISERLKNNTSKKEQEVITSYIDCAAPYNGLLRGTKLPKEKETQEKLEKNIDTLSKVLKNNPLEQDMTTHRGVDDFFLRKLLKDNNFTEALKGEDLNEVNHEWIGQNIDEFNRRMSGVVYMDPGFSSSTTQREFAERWSKKSGRYFMKKELDQRLKDGKITKAEYEKKLAEMPEGADISGAHVIDLDLPKGAPVAAIDRAGMINRGPSGQHEMLIDKGSMFQFMGLTPGKVPGSYNMKSRLLSEEEGKKRRPPQKND